MNNDSPPTDGQFSDARVKLRRFWRRTQLALRQLLQRPALRAGAVILCLAGVTAFILNQWEFRYASRVDDQGQTIELKGDGPYGTLPKTIRNVTVFLFSGFDAEQPKTDVGFALAMVCLFLGFGLLALMTGDLASLLVTAAMVNRGRRRIRARNHIVLCGWHFTARSLVNELISRQRKPRREIVVVDEDTDEIEVYDPDVHLVRGDPTDMEILRRANAARAHAAIIPINWKLPEAVQDSRTTLAALAISALNENIYTCVEVLHPHNKRHVRRTNVDEIICLGDFSRTLIASAAVAHGASRLLDDILTFNRGSEIYRLGLPAALAGRTFRWLLRRLNEQRGIVLLSVERAGVMHTNPQGDFPLAPGDVLFLLAAGHPEKLAELDAAASNPPASAGRGRRP